jgi:hypothetical protein
LAYSLHSCCMQSPIQHVCPLGQCADVASVLENMLKNLEVLYPGRCVKVTQNGPNHNRLAVVLGWACHGAIQVRFQQNVSRMLGVFCF